MRYIVTTDNMPNWMYIVFDTHEDRPVACKKAPGWLRFRAKSAAQKKADQMNKEMMK